MDGDGEASVEDPDEGNPQDDHNAKEEDPELREDCRTISANANHCAAEKSQKDVLEDDESFDISCVLGSDPVYIEASEKSNKSRECNCSH